MTDVVIVSAARTAVGKFGGSLAKIAAPDLGAAVIRAVLERANLKPRADQRSDPGPGAGRRLRPEPGAPVASSRRACPQAVPGMTINKVCGSGLKAVMLAAQGDHRGRRRHRDRRRPGKHERGAARAAGLARRLPHGRLEAGRLDDRRRPVGRLQPVPHGRHGGERREGIRHHARGAGQVRGARRSTRPKPRRRRAASRTRSSPVDIPQRKGDPVVFATDEFVDTEKTAEALAGLRPAFDKAGTVTAGNASGLNDGAAAVVVMSAKKAEALGLTPLARIEAYANAGSTRRSWAWARCRRREALPGARRLEARPTST